MINGAFYIIAGTNEPSAVVYHSASLTILHEFVAPHRDAVVAVSISNNMKYIATG